MKSEKENISLDVHSLVNFGRNLLKINYQAFNQRYPDDKEDILETEIYIFKMPDILKYEPEVFLYGLLCATECLKYQINEDNFDELYEFKLLEDISLYLCEKLNISIETLRNTVYHSIYDDRDFKNEFYC